MKTFARIVFFLMAIFSLPSPVHAERYHIIHIKVITPEEVRLEGKRYAIKDLTNAIQKLCRSDSKLEVRIVIPMASNIHFLKEVTDCCRNGGATLVIVVQTS